MRFEDVPDDVLELLAAMLRVPGLPVQKDIARAIGADQALVSRVRNREVKRVTPRIANLWNYVNQRIAEQRRAGAASEEIDSDVSKNALLKPKRRARHLPNVSTLGPASQYADDAISGVKAYLADGYDARLILEQIQVLRRAQHVRRAGRSRDV